MCQAAEEPVGLLKILRGTHVHANILGPSKKSEYLLVNLDFLGFGPFPWMSNAFTRNEAQEQHSLLDTIFDYILYFGPLGKYLYLSPKTHYMSAGEAADM